MRRHIYALHEGPLDWLDSIDGWAVLTVHAWQAESVDARAIVEAGQTPIARLNNGYGTEGTIPPVGTYQEFAARLGLIAANSPDCHIWIVGNEPNHEQEWPAGMKIFPDEYAACYSLCRNAIKAQAGHERDEVLVAAIAPWTAKVSYYGNERGDWVKYLADVIAMLGEPDGYALHTYTHTHDAQEVTEDQPMGAPFADRQYQFRAYRDFMTVIPPGAPVYITETCPVDSGWSNVNNGWVRAAYREIDEWNRTAQTPIRCLALYRGVDVDRWYFADKGNVRIDWDLAVGAGYSVEVDDDGGDEVPTDEWMQVYYNACERGFYDQDGEGALTVPVDTHVWWLEDPSSESKLNRPEMDFKDAQQHIEVYEGRYSANGFFQSTTGRLWLVSDPVYVQNGRPVRGTCAYMHVLRTTQGGGRLGILDGEGPFRPPYERPPSDEGPLTDPVVWGAWANQSLANNQWVELATPQVVPASGSVRLVAQFNSDWAGFAAAHWDVFAVEQLVDGEAPGPAPGPTPGPGAEVDYARIRAIVREELDATRLTH